VSCCSSCSHYVRVLLCVVWLLVVFVCWGYRCVHLLVGLLFFCISLVCAHVLHRFHVGCLVFSFMFSVSPCVFECCVVFCVVLGLAVCALVGWFVCFVYLCGCC